MLKDSCDCRANQLMKQRFIIHPNDPNSIMKNKKTKKLKVVAVSGGFDPIHIGHIRLFEAAKKLGDTLTVILNNDNWLQKKKGYVFMPEQERKELIGALRSVDSVLLTSHKKNPNDMSVSAELKKLKPHIFANGGDRTHRNIPEVAACESIGCEMVFSVGKGGKIQSSSWLLAKHNKRELCFCGGGKVYQKCHGA